MKKSIFTRIKSSVIIAYNTPTLPVHMIQLENNIFIRIFRVLGGISVITLLSLRTYSDIANPIIIQFALIFTILFIFYKFYVMYYRIKHVYFLVFKSNKLEIRNSPLDKAASHLLKALVCAKGFCENVAIVGGLLGLGNYYDNILVDQGKEPIISPIIRKIIFADKPSLAEEAYNSNLKSLSEIKKFDKEIEVLSEARKSLEAVMDNSFTPEVKSELLEILSSESSKLGAKKATTLEEIIKRISNK